MKIPCYKGLSWLGILALSVNCAVAALTTTSSFTAISGGVFVNGAGYSLLQPYNSGPLTITPSFNFGSGTFSGYTPPGVPGEPGDGNGFLASFRAPSPNGDLTLDFSTPVRLLAPPSFISTPRHCADGDCIFPAPYGHMTDPTAPAICWDRSTVLVGSLLRWDTTLISWA